MSLASSSRGTAFMGLLKWASGLTPMLRLHLRPFQRHFNILGLTNRFLHHGLRWISPFLWTLLPRGGAPIWGNPRHWERAPEQTTNSISFVWGSRWYFWPYKAGPQSFRSGHISTGRLGTRFYSLFQLVVDLFLWLHSQDIVHSAYTHTMLPQCDCRSTVLAVSANHHPSL